MKCKVFTIQIVFLAALLCLQCSAAITYNEQSVSTISTTILDTKLVQTQANDYVLATYATLSTDNSYQLTVTFLSNSSQGPLIVNDDVNTFAWDIRPSSNDSQPSSVDVFFSTPSNSSWYIERYYSDGTTLLISEENNSSFIPNSFLVYQPSQSDYGCYVVANSNRELYMSDSGNLTQIGEFISINFASFAVGEVNRSSPPLFFIGVSAAEPRSAIWYVDPSSDAGAVPQRIDSSEGILSIDVISLDATGLILVHENLNGFTKIYQWQMSNPIDTFNEFQIQGTFTLLPFMSSPAGRFLVYNSAPLPAFGKTQLTQWVNWDGNDPSESSGYVVENWPSISGLASMMLPGSFYLETQALSIIIAYPSGGNVRITELNFQGSTNQPQNIVISGFQVPQGLSSSNCRRRILTSADDHTESIAKTSAVTSGMLRTGNAIL